MGATAGTGGTVDHNTIVQNLVVGSRHATREGPCRVFSENVKVIVDGAVMYPDVSQDEPRIEIYRRSDEGWSYIIVTGLQAAITLEPGSTTIPLAGIYEQSSVASS